MMVLTFGVIYVHDLQQMTVLERGSCAQRRILGPIDFGRFLVFI